MKGVRRWRAEGTGKLNNKVLNTFRVAIICAGGIFYAEHYG